ncbi:MAG: hypothetical protein NZ772_05015 [Cyanobacteria bacterium]|nr:hypothetical protein [Cyanobacteriota bacterium]MDW8200856.1 hypothetical protein [Cyanobacteriota bacterium SKYGB_h_bin112]
METITTTMLSLTDAVPGTVPCTGISLWRLSLQQLQILQRLWRLLPVATIALLFSAVTANSAWGVCTELAKLSLLDSLSVSVLPSDTVFGERYPGDLSDVEEIGNCALPDGIVTEKITCQRASSVPSLWWAQAQYGGKLLVSWSAYPQRDQNPPRVDLLVNQQLWISLGYVERYRFLAQFGRASSEFGYNVRIFDSRGTCLATYTCSYDAKGNPVTCQTLLPTLRRDRL